jgi:AcrR family transcriptional regulator
MYNSFMTDVSPPSIEEDVRFKRVIRAAEDLFKRIGFRAVTMELVAREANVAKATLYSRFKNKDELFIAVCARLARLLRGAVEQGLARPDEPLDMRLAEAVIAKHRLVFTLVRGSVHAAELFSYKDVMAGEIFVELDATVLKILTEAMAEDLELSPRAERLARALYLGGAHLAHRSETLKGMESELREFAAVHLAGARALAKREHVS